MLHSNLPALIFSPSADDITIPAGGDVVVATTVADASGTTIFDNTSTYSPRADGNVYLAELSELVNAAVLTTFSPGSMLSPGARSAGCTLTIKAGSVTRQTHALYMWRDITDIKPMFATQVRSRRVIEGMAMPVNILTAGQSGLKLVVGAAYRLANGDLAWRESTIEPDCSQDYFTVNAAVSGVRAITSAPLGSTLLYYVLTLLTADNAQADRIHFSIDRKTNASAATYFIYLNLFGVPDCIVFRGKQTEDQDLDSDFGYAGREYVRLDAQLTEGHKANSGWLTAEELHAAYDFMSSPFAFVLHADGSLRRITITELDSSVSRPSHEPCSVQLTWRYADSRLMRQPHVTPDTGKAAVFAKPPFDKSFS